MASSQCVSRKEMKDTSYPDRLGDSDELCYKYESPKTVLAKHSSAFNSRTWKAEADRSV